MSTHCEMLNWKKIIKKDIRSYFVKASVLLRTKHERQWSWSLQIVWPSSLFKLCDWYKSVNFHEKKFKIRLKVTSTVNNSL